MRLFLVSLPLLMFLACSGEGTNNVEADAAPEPDALSETCSLRLSNLQTALDGLTSRQGTALGVATADCPTLSVTSGTTIPNEQSLFRLASVTKTYVAAAIVSQSEAGLLTLDDTLDEWAPDFPNASVITIAQLLQHTSGAFDYTRTSDFQNTATQQTPQTPDDLIAIAAKHEPVFSPGMSWEYSNTNYILLGKILEETTGESIAAVLRERALVPANLSNTFLDGEETVLGTFAPGYNSQGTDVTNLYHPSWAWTAGAMVGTIGDAADWIDALYGGNVLNETGRKKLTQDPIEIGGGLAYGLGTMIISEALSGGAGPGVGHGGDIAGYHSLVLYFPQEDTTIAAIVTSDAANPNDVLVAAMETLFSN